MMKLFKLVTNFHLVFLLINIFSYFWINVTHSGRRIECIWSVDNLTRGSSKERKISHLIFLCICMNLTRENYIKDQRIRSTFTFHFFLFLYRNENKNMKIKAKQQLVKTRRKWHNEKFLLFNLFLVKSKN